MISHNKNQPLEAILTDLPSTIYDPMTEHMGWLMITASTTGVWSAGYQDYTGLMHDSFFGEGDTPTKAALALRKKVKDFEAISNGIN